LTAGGERVVLAAGDEGTRRRSQARSAACPARHRSKRRSRPLMWFCSRWRLDRDSLWHGHVPGTLDPLSPIRPGVLPRRHRFKDMGMGRGLRAARILAW